MAANTAASAGNREFLRFCIGEEQYGVDILAVQEIRNYETPTTIANAAAYLKGVINLRGEIVPIMDLRIKFDLSKVEYGAQTVTIIVNVAERVIGVVVDSVSDVVQLTEEQMRPAPALTSSNQSHIIGIGTLDDGMLILIDIGKLLAAEELPGPEEIAA